MNQVKVFFVLKGLIEPDYHGVIESPKDFNLVLKTFWVFDHFFGDEFDDAIGVRRFFESGLVDDPVGPSAEHLLRTERTLGLN